MKHLVIGLGEIGSAIKTVLEEKYGKDHVFGIDYNEESPDRVDVIHICFGWSPDFKNEVEKYKNLYLKDGCLTIIHATVPVGTSRSCGAVHSPVRGIHPHLVNGLKTFVKFFGGDRSEEASHIFDEIASSVVFVDKSETTEALKLWETTIYAWNIVIEKEIYDYCAQHDIDFNTVYTQANLTYNEGYEKLGYPHYKKFVLKHVCGEIGGHCLVPNAKLLNNWIGDLILSKNESYKEQS